MIDDLERSIWNQFIDNARNAIGDRNLQDVAAKAGMKPRHLKGILRRRTVPDLADIRALEIALRTELWPAPKPDAPDE
ncbi:helix-turn-helix transcriptional regulator [Leifsonia aquatica]|uniref:DNA-binding phage protein n=1 Tax=Leifsonia aquatica TaxID=144185 RepID=A0A7W4UXZ2_LEIAQ|nr:helix-turn-helix transcriptional regulator [Leifsonia aquatica]MBB2967997.1 DNA-binding phage protein [Leifsonia aquatica]